MKDCIKCDEFQRDRQGRECQYCSWKPPVAESQTGADEYDEVEALFLEHVDSVPVRRAMELAYAAGRARGIEEADCNGGPQADGRVHSHKMACVEKQREAYARGIEEGAVLSADEISEWMRLAREIGHDQGARDERKRCEGIARNQAASRRVCADRIGDMSTLIEHLEEKSVQTDLAFECDAIADAIAKESSHG